MPTLLPERPKSAPRKPTFAELAFNSFMVISALALTYLVLVQEENYALGRTTPAAVEQDQTGSIGQSDHRGIPEPR